MSGDRLPIWTIFDHPRDYPNAFVARRFDVTRKGIEITADVILAASLEELRGMLPMGLTRLERSPGDDPNIIESWI